MARGTYNEFKYLVTNENLAYIKHLLEALYSHSDPFPAGKVDSIYYDDLYHSALSSCMGGNHVKRKVRIRGYGDGQYPFFQLKTKDLYSVGKIKAKLAPLSFTLEQAPSLADLTRINTENTAFQAVALSLLCHGEMVPIVHIRYFRYRFRVNDHRVTLDTNIEITGLGAGPAGCLVGHRMLPAHVLEIKTFDQKPHLPFMGLIKLPQISFSKFSLGINLLQQGIPWVS